MDWYLLGLVLGIFFWPLATALLVVGVGRLAALRRPAHVAENIRGWSRFFAGLVFLGTLIVTARELLRYAGIV